jgi:epoxyqueuosine reductase
VELAQAIKEQAYRLGFSLVGVTSSDRLPHSEVFEAWLDQGRHAEMTYMNSPRSRACRAHPGQVLLECRSVLVLGARYPSPPVLSTNGLQAQSPHGRVASYAWGEDYHKSLPIRLQSLVTFIEAQLGHSIPNRWYTDTGPLLERELAQRAGLGWIGKNTCLINPDRGSYFLLAEILLGIELEPDEPFTLDRCGTCTRCITACPTGCILPDRTIDACRCISYLTIELKGSIPLELRPSVGTWVFGCDVCQQVCPWNRFAAREVDPAFEPHIAHPSPNLLDELALQASDFNRKYRHSPLMRAKRKGYLRNIAVALGNLHTQDAVPALSRTLHQEGEPLVRAHAAWALGQIGGASARQALERAMGSEPDPSAKSEIQSSLEYL